MAAVIRQNDIAEIKAKQDDLESALLEIAKVFGSFNEALSRLTEVSVTTSENMAVISQKIVSIDKQVNGLEKEVGVISEV